MPDGNPAASRSKRNWRRGFSSLIATQFQGAFNENALKFLIIYLVLALGKDQAQRDRLQRIGSAPYTFLRAPEMRADSHLLRVPLEQQRFDLSL